MICNNQTERSRTLPEPPCKNSRSRSLPKISDKNNPKRKCEVKQIEAAIVNKSLSQSLNTLSRQGIIKPIEEETVEIPVIVDEVTKWITGVNKSTTCQDVIKAILQREADTYQVRSYTSKDSVCH